MPKNPGKTQSIRSYLNELDKRTFLNKKIKKNEYFSLKDSILSSKNSKKNNVPY
jgi:hypothetical protein